MRSSVSAARRFRDYGRCRTSCGSRAFRLPLSGTPADLRRDGMPARRHRARDSSRTRRSERAVPGVVAGLPTEPHAVDRRSSRLQMRLATPETVRRNDVVCALPPLSSRGRPAVGGPAGSEDPRRTRVPRKGEVHLREGEVPPEPPMGGQLPKTSPLGKILIFANGPCDRWIAFRRQCGSASSNAVNRRNPALGNVNRFPTGRFNTFECTLAARVEPRPPGTSPSRNLARKRGQPTL